MVTAILEAHYQIWFWSGRAVNLLQIVLDNPEVRKVTFEGSYYDYDNLRQALKHCGFGVDFEYIDDDCYQCKIEVAWSR